MHYANCACEIFVIGSPPEGCDPEDFFEFWQSKGWSIIEVNEPPPGDELSNEAKLFLLQEVDKDSEDVLKRFGLDIETEESPAITEIKPYACKKPTVSARPRSRAA